MFPPWFHITLVIKQQISTIIDQQFVGKRLDKVVVELFDGAYSRSRLSAWIRDGLVTIDGEAVMKPGGTAKYFRPGCTLCARGFLVLE